MTRGRHRDTGGKHTRPSGKGKENTSDPKTCAHQNHQKTAASGGQAGYQRYCPSCESEWWTPN